MAGIDIPKGSETFEKELERLGLSHEVKKKLLEEDRDLMDGIRKCRHMADLLDVIVSIEPDAPLTELKDKYSHFWEYVNAKARKGLDRVREERKLAEMVRDQADTVLSFMEADDKLINRPMSFMAFKVSSPEGQLQIDEVNTDAKSNIGDKKKWVEDVKNSQFQLLFYSVGGEWKLLHNTTGVDDDIILREFSQERLKKEWGDDAENRKSGKNLEEGRK